jgi:hypothetical protein
MKSMYNLGKRRRCNVTEAILGIPAAAEENFQIRLPSHWLLGNGSTPLSILSSIPRNPDPEIELVSETALSLPVMPKTSSVLPSCEDSSGSLDLPYTGVSLVIESI